MAQTLRRVSLPQHWRRTEAERRRRRDRRRQQAATVSTTSETGRAETCGTCGLVAAMVRPLAWPLWSPGVAPATPGCISLRRLPSVHGNRLREGGQVASVAARALY